MATAARHCISLCTHGYGRVVDSLVALCIEFKTTVLGWTRLLDGGNGVGDGRGGDDVDENVPNSYKGDGGNSDGEGNRTQRRPNGVTPAHDWMCCPRNSIEMQQAMISTCLTSRIHGLQIFALASQTLWGQNRSST